MTSTAKNKTYPDVCKKSQTKYDVSIQGYTGIGKIPMTIPKTIIGILPIPVYPYCILAWKHH